MPKDSFLDKMRNTIFFFLILTNSLIGEVNSETDRTERLFADLEKVSEINLKQKESLPTYFNRWGNVGYLEMPSARSSREGNLALSAYRAFPYSVYSANVQILSRISLSGNYTVINGKNPSQRVERSGNIQWSLLKKEDGLPSIPEISLGFRDFFGAKNFFSFYVAATKTFLSSDLEITGGWGLGRIQGFFGALAWSPFRSKKGLFEEASFLLEYDATNYKKEFLSQKIPINIGFSWKLFDVFQFNISSSRGKELAGGASIFYNLGETTGIFPKISDPPLYYSPKNHQALGEKRNKSSFAKGLAEAFKEQGLDLFTVRKEKNTLWIKVVNQIYRQKDLVKKRIESVLLSLVPKNIEKVQVVIEASGLSLQEYTFSKTLLEKGKNQALPSAEWDILTPMRESTKEPSRFASELLFERKKPLAVYAFQPIFRSYFGSSSGKFQYDVGISTSLDGYLFDSLYYYLSGSYVIQSSKETPSSIDLENPSQLVNVRSDAILYRQSSSVHIDQAYLQKNWNLGSGMFSKLSLGYFEVAYAGFGSEFLYYPVKANWAIGLEGAFLKKRNYHGFGLQNRVRKLQGTVPTYVPYYGLQYFLNLYYQFNDQLIDFTCNIGQFLAKDRGVRLEATKRFPSGWDLSFWVTYTNGNDRVEGKRYFDKGIAFSIPLDLFLNKSSRKRFGYALSERLRDVGAKAFSGTSLYDTLYNERMGYRSYCY